MLNVIESIESPRGCGNRKPGKSGVSIYLVGPLGTGTCDMLPWPLTICPCCSAGIKPTRGWTWIKPEALFAGAMERCHHPSCIRCPIGRPPSGKHGLLWIGEQYYGTTGAFIREAQEMGISRKLSAIPNDFELGKTIVYLAHRQAIQPSLEAQLASEVSGGCGVFATFRPTGIDLVIENADNIPQRAQTLAKMPGTRLIKVITTGNGNQGELFATKGE